MTKKSKKKPKAAAVSKESPRLSLVSMTHVPNRVTEHAPKIDGSVQHDVDKIFNHGVLIDLKIGFWSAKVRNAAEDLGISRDALAPMIVGLGTKRLCPKEVSDSWQKIAASARYIVRRDAFSFPIADVAFVPLTVLPKVERQLLDLQTAFNKAAAFITNNVDTVTEKWFQEQPVDLRPRLRRLVPSKEVLRSRFYFTFSAFTVTVPKKVRVESAKRERMEAEERAQLEARERYRAQLEARVQQFSEDAGNTLMQKAVEVCSTIAAKIKTGEVVTNRSLNTLRTFVDRFKELGDWLGLDRVEQKLTALKREMLSDHTAEDFHAQQAREQLVTALDGVREAALKITDRSSSGLAKRRIIID